jgi:hypothetical protein
MLHKYTSHYPARGGGTAAYLHSARCAASIRGTAGRTRRAQLSVTSWATNNKGNKSELLEIPKDSNLMVGM